MGIFNRTTLAAAAILIGAAFGPATAASLKFSVAAEPYPPFASKNAAGVWEGFEVDLAKAICKAGSMDCEIVETAWDGIIPALLAKKIDVIFASMSITDERSKTIAFSIPYYNTPPAWIADKSTQLTLTPEGLKGKTIGVQIGTIHLDYANKYYGAGSTVKTYQTQDEANSDLAAGRIDVALADSAALDAFLDSDAGKCCETKGYADKNDPIFGTGVGAGLRKEDTELKAKIDAAIAAVYKSGEYETIEKKYFKYDIGTPPKS
ncbi:transporter substrate-binding domain-containing protein [Labrys wisconsinensis]|uniref:Polar amino acid transport system substrate-binding protein n=1 Tax=Labrys wisconsinensis TaxID=425677 RepID=A0ABU0J445_9HYPH|nr:transporter substrate-binding domain-containing protein [Labrys wisconsinensis]MDQ0469009.1 polar amino acid transport system substrate-binding protein [Labrys wisconsinensis]